MIADDIQTKDQQHLWHPCSQMKDYEQFPPLVITGAQGSYLECADGTKIIDAISSWWCKSLGHGHPRIKQALLNQMDKFEHVILANTTNETIIELSETLTSLMPGLDKVTYTSDGSCGVEIALKMSLHARKISGDTKRTQFMALSNGYHGETSGAMSVSDLGIYKHPYSEMLFEAHFIDNIPYVLTSNDPLWNDCSSIWPDIKASLQPYAQTTTALLVEPILQGAGGMKIYSQDFLKRLANWTHENNIHLIADEILTGIGRTGKMLACEHAGIKPDFICLGKGLTAGWLPLSAVMISNDIYEVFYDDYGKGKDFLHSHTHTGNALAASVALEALKVTHDETLCERATLIGQIMLENMRDIADQTGALKNVRGIGAMVAADLVVEDVTRRTGYEVYQQAVKRGAFLRPLGNTIYWLPPLNITLETMGELKTITEQSIRAISLKF